MQPQPPVQERPKVHWFWWIVAVGLLIWNILVFLPKIQAEVTIPYSVFIQQVNAGNVLSVHISGSEISGQFVKAIPDPAATATAPAGGNASATAAAPLTYTDFVTIFPDTQGDASFMALMEQHSVVVDVAPPPNPILSALFSSFLPLLLFVGVMVWIGRKTAQSQAGLTSIGRSKAREYRVDRPDVTFADVAGVDEAKQELREVVDFLREPQKYHKLGARIPRGVLLVGAPGTGKTLLARAVAGEASAPFFDISGSEFVEMFVGVGASRVRDLFAKAKANAPAIVFIDEIDAVGRRRGTGMGAVNDEREQTLNQLLVEMDGFDENHETIVVAATNRPDVLDPALLRPGRFDRQVTVALPDRRGREQILRIHTRKLALGEDVNLDALAGSTTGFSGADLANLCNEAALNAARENHSQIKQADFYLAIDRLLLGLRRSLALNDKQRRIIAYHESGHALVAWLSPEADQVNKVTIIPRGKALGVTEQIPGEDQYNYSREYLLTRLAVMLGGRVSEEIALGSITTGAENDLAEATRLARRMVTRWGMGGLGSMAFVTNEEQPFLGYEMTQGREYSEALAAKIDEDVEKLLAERYDYARKLLESAREPLERLVQELLKEETVQQEDLERVLGARPGAAHS